MTKVDIADIDRDFLAITGLWSQLMDVLNHPLSSICHPFGWHMDGHGRHCKGAVGIRNRPLRDAAQPGDEFCRGTKPSQAANSRPERNTFGSATVVAMAVANSARCARNAFNQHRALTH